MTTPELRLLAPRVPEIEPLGLPLAWTDPADAPRLESAYERMLLIRRFEEEIQRQFLRGEIHGTTHLCNGEEAIFVGVSRALRDGDMVAATYRGHGHALARGIPPTALAAEMMGRATGVCGGRAGSMNVIDLERGLLGCFGIVGGTLAAATGAALGLRDRGGVAVAGFGEGTANQAYFAECLNFAKVFELPAVFVCENNLYGEFTPWEAVTAGADVSARAAVLGIPTRRIDGNDVRAVHAAAVEAADRARAGGGPTFLECVTYRQVGHSRSDPGAYRPAGELEAWLEKDPLRRTRADLEALGVAGTDLDALEGRVDGEIAGAFASALAAPYPDPATTASEYR
jgi:TPP-dependent pyruvate/acetoin dehydrogenase alpha subunit